VTTVMKTTLTRINLVMHSCGTYDTVDNDYFKEHFESKCVILL